MVELFGDRLLLIDDEPALGRVVKRVAEECGFEVVATDDPAIFLNAARLWHPSVIMLDLKMPGVDGVELLRALAADQSPGHIIITSGADAKVLEAAQQLGHERGLDMAGIVQKPIRADTLRELLSPLKRVPKLLLAADLARGLLTDQLFLEYQPKLDCRKLRVTGVEALVRWRHPVHDIVTPDQFVVLAEENGLVSRLTDRVVGEAVAQVARWHADKLALDLAINISARDLEDLDLPDRLERHCRQAAIDPALLTLELTETGAMREAIQMMDVLTRLRIKGFKLSIDDFGTGYSSLAQLQKMPFSEVKIDGSFVVPMLRNQGCRAIVEIIIELARKLGLRSVAEGVEDQATLDTLTALGCDAAQGYHLCRPLAGPDIADFVRQYNRTGGGEPGAGQADESRLQRSG